MKLTCSACGTHSAEGANESEVMENLEQHIANEHNMLTDEERQYHINKMKSQITPE